MASFLLSVCLGGKLLHGWKEIFHFLEETLSYFVQQLCHFTFPLAESGVGVFTDTLYLMEKSPLYS